MNGCSPSTVRITELNAVLKSSLKSFNFSETFFDNFPSLNDNPSFGRGFGVRECNLQQNERKYVTRN